MLKAVVTDLNTVDEAHRGLYAEKDGKFFLQVTSAEGYELDNVAGLKSALGAERNLKKGLEDQLKVFEGLDPALARQSIERLSAFGDITPDAAKAALETAARLSAIDPEKEADKLADAKVKTQTEALKAQFNLRETELAGQVNAAKSTIDGLTGQLQTLMRDNAITSELAKLNPLDDARDALEMLARAFIKTSIKDGQVVVEVLDAQGHPRIKDHNGTPFTVGDLMAELREQRPSLFKPTAPSGTGMAPTTGAPPASNTQNPWKKESWSFTQQMTLENTNPKLAARLKAEAGAS